MAGCWCQGQTGGQGGLLTSQGVSFLSWSWHMNRCTEGGGMAFTPEVIAGVITVVSVVAAAAALGEAGPSPASPCMALGSPRAHLA